MDWNNKEEVLRAFDHGLDQLWLASETLRDDIDVVTAAIKNNGSSLIDASDRLRDDKELTLLAIEHEDIQRVLEFASDRLKNDPDVVLAAVANDGEAIINASASLQASKDFIQEAITTNPDVYEFIDDKLKNDPTIQRIYDISSAKYSESLKHSSASILEFER